MIDSYAVQHCEHVGQRSFETVVAAIEAEFATLPSLPNVADWNAYQAALQALTLIPNLSRAEPAARLTEPKGNGASRQPAVLVANNDKQTTAIGAQVNEQCTDSDGEKKEYCLAAHDTRKEELVQCAKDNLNVLGDNSLYATRATGQLLENRLGLKRHDSGE